MLKRYAIKKKSDMRYWGDKNPATIIDTQDEWHRLHERCTDEEIVASFECAQREDTTTRVVVNGSPCIAVMHKGYIVLVGMVEVRAAWARVLKKKIDNNKLTILAQIDHEDFA